MKRYHSMDCIKGICCIAVVFIHYNFPGELGSYVKALARFAVPYFFFISGFFLMGRDMKINKKQIYKKIRHIGCITISACIFYAIFCIVFNIISDPGWDLKTFLFDKFNPSKFVKFFVTNDPFVYPHLWYLFALLYCYFFMLLFNNKRYPKWLSLITLPLLIGFLLLSEFKQYTPLRATIPIPGTENLLILPNLFIFRALSFFLVGISFRAYEENISRLKFDNKLIAGLIIVGSVLSLLERHFWGDYQFYVGTYCQISGLYIFSIRFSDWNNHVLEYIGRNLSLYVYIYHIAIGKIILFTAGKLHIQKHPCFTYTSAFLILLVTLFLSFIIFAVKQRKKI